MKSYLAQTSQPATSSEPAQGECGLLNPAWVPFWQTSLWIIFWLLIIWFIRSNFNQHLSDFLNAFIRRINDGSPLKAGPSGLELGASPPPAIANEQVNAATAEGTRGLEVKNLTLVASKDDDEKAKHLETIKEKVANYQENSTGIAEEVYLVHQAEVIIPKTAEKRGVYTVRVWLEAYKEECFNDCVRVTYRLFQNFNPPVIATQSSQNQFELWLNTYGEFTVIAYVERKNPKEPLWLTRYLDLPGRPPD